MICGFFIYYKFMFFIFSYVRRGFEVGVVGIRRWFCFFKESFGIFCCVKIRIKIFLGIKNKYWLCCVIIVLSFLF